MRVKALVALALMTLMSCDNKNTEMSAADFLSAVTAATDGACHMKDRKHHCRITTVPTPNPDVIAVVVIVVSTERAADPKGNEGVNAPVAFDWNLKTGLVTQTK